MSTRPTPPRPEADPQRRVLLRAVAAACASALGGGLSACGGGGEPTSPAATPATTDGLRQPLRGIDSGGTGRVRSLFVSAPVASTAPLQLNAQVFNTAASVVVDGEGLPLALDQLQPGMSAQVAATQRTVGGSLQLPEAQTIRVAEQLLGELQAVDVASASLRVLGQRVVLTAATVLDPALAGGLAALQPGQRVQVWGELDLGGARTVATRLAAAPAAPVAEVLRGVLGTLERGAGLASIGTQALQFAPGDSAAVPAELLPGMVVRARVQPGSAGGVAQLLSLRLDALQLPERSDIELEGRVSWVEDARHFGLDGVAVDASSVAGSPVLLVPGQRVSAQGRSRNGVLQASTLEVEQDEPVELEGRVSTADAGQQQFVLGDVTVRWDSSTVFVGGPASLLAPRRAVAVIGRWLSHGTVLLATRIHVEA